MVSAPTAEARSGGTPRFYVGARRVEIPDYNEPDATYLRRWYLVETPWFGVKLHHILRSDSPDRGFHDHPWGFVSVKLRGSYTERRLIKHGRADIIRRTGRHRITRVRPDTLHLVDIDDTTKGVWTLVLNGPRRRVWGFRKPFGQWVAWNESPGPQARTKDGEPWKTK